MRPLSSPVETVLCSLWWLKVVCGEKVVLLLSKHTVLCTFSVFLSSLLNL